MPKMDKKLVARFDNYEMHYICGRYRIPMIDVRIACASAGRSRKKVYDALRAKGYVINVKTKK